MLLFISATVAHHLPSGLLRSQCFVESGHRVAAVHHDDGNGDSLGICQMKLNTARMLGFKGTVKQLMDPTINIHYAALYLRKQLDRYGESVYQAVAAYNSGTYRPGPRGAKNQLYVDRVMQAWRDGR